jgi:NHLM bacteriocin system ABC transporter ATP-binding protein
MISGQARRAPIRKTIPFGTMPAPLAGEGAPPRIFQGDTMELGGNRPFTLDGLQAFQVLRGEVNLFTVGREDGLARGPRRHLTQVSAGGLLLGLGAESRSARRTLLAAPTTGTLLELGTHQDLQALVRSGSADHALTLIEGWIETLSRGIARSPAPDGCQELGPGAALAIPQPAAIRGRAAVSWIRPLEGRALLAGRPDLELSAAGFTPVFHDVWLAIPETAWLALLPSSALPDQDSLWRGLARLAQLVLLDAEHEAAQSQVADARIARDKAAASAATLVAACERLAGALKTTVFAPEVVDESDSVVEGAATQADQLLAACKLVGSDAGIAIKAPPRVQRAGGHDPLGSILRSSRVRARQVALRGQWWQQDHGPLLAFLAAGQGIGPPVALLHGRQGYTLHRPRTPSWTDASDGKPPVAVDARTAAALAPFAFSFYRPFPEGRLDLRSILAFGFRGNAGDLSTVLVMGLLSAVLGLMPSLAIDRLFNEIIPGAHRSQLLQMSVLLMAAAVGSAGFAIARGIALLRMSTRAGPAIQAAIWDRLLRLPLRFFRPHAAGDLAVRAMAISSIQQILSSLTLGAIMSGIFSLLNVGLMFHYSSPLAWRAVVVLAGALLLTVAGGLLQLRPQRQLILLRSKASGLVLQLLSNIGKIRVAGAEVRAFARWVAVFAAQRRKQFLVQFIGNWIKAFHGAFPLLASVAMYATVVPLVGAGPALPRTGDFLAFLAAFGACLGAMLSTTSALLGSLAVLPLYQQAQPILEATPEVDQGRSTPGALSGDVEVQHATFRYHPDSPVVLRDLSFRVSPGEYVAFVGASGSGKSTLLKLLLGFETLESGSISYDGQELGGLDLPEVRRQMGVVLQNGQLMAGDILTNIVGSGAATLEQAHEAAERTGLTDDIKQMPMGMHTMINDGVGTLSGGQRQRLLIARAIVNRPRILLLDEATSALDNRTQAIVSASLERLQATRIVVAHRLSTIARAHRIYVLERGRIVQCGTYADLMADERGPFAQLARRQLL